MDPTPNRRVAALLGNGVSIAFNNELALPKINDELRQRLNRDVEEGDPASVLTEAANKIDTGDPYTDFESLLGPLDQQYDFIDMMAKYAAIIGKANEGAAKSLNEAATFVRQVRRTGTSFALEIISERSKASTDDMDGIYGFVDALVDAAGSARLTIANLNYDSLAMAALSHSHGHRFCDMARGYGEERLEIAEGVVLTGYPLRTSPNFPTERNVRLLHLHGSLTWLRSPEGKVYRFATCDLRDHKFWDLWRNNLTSWQPVVVLTNQTAKTDVVKEEPYALAYATSEAEFVNSDRWLIAGYSFRDECVNNMLARAWAARETRPQILVIAHGKEPGLGAILHGVGYRWWEDEGASGFIDVVRMGLPDALTTPEWKRWAGIAKADAA